jgi:hypothetical protein
MLPMGSLGTVFSINRGRGDVLATIGYAGSSGYTRSVNERGQFKAVKYDVSCTPYAGLGLCDRQERLPFVGIFLEV